MSGHFVNPRTIISTKLIWIPKKCTVCEKILEGGNFGESLLMKQMARKILVNLLAGLQLFHCIYNY